ncbi:NUDIX hydrolase domain-like protein [Scenedesmus sp. NREL 46B-D3]|nr:NUDIX hydrolase domain-like protein [Scenedesmus sp. NREL 46B-D3]
MAAAEATKSTNPTPAARPTSAQSAGEGIPEKLGAGLLLCCQGKVLLLKRCSRHNDQTWGLPGGNAEPADQGLLSTALREAQEELGEVPAHEHRAQILTKRGKRNQKHYTVFLADVAPSTAQQYAPRLNAEHSEWRWVPWNDVTAANSGAADGLTLHPVVCRLAQQHAAEVQGVLHAGQQPEG